MAPKQWHHHSKHNKLDSILAALTSVVKGQGAKAGGNRSKGQGKGKGKVSKGAGKGGSKGKGPDHADTGTYATEPKPCKCCGRTNHKHADCIHREKECGICGKV